MGLEISSPWNTNRWDYARGKKYVPQFKFFISGFSESPFGIEWMRFEENSPIDRLIQSVPHLAFEVSNLDYELSVHDLKVITEPNSPSHGVRVAMIEHNGAPGWADRICRKYLNLLKLRIAVFISVRSFFCILITKEIKNHCKSWQYLINTSLTCRVT